MEKNINNVNEQSTNLGKDICNIDDRKCLKYRNRSYKVTRKT